MTTFILTIENLSDDKLSDLLNDHANSVALGYEAPAEAADFLIDRNQNIMLQVEAQNFDNAALKASEKVNNWMAKNGYCSFEIHGLFPKSTFGSVRYF